MRIFFPASAEDVMASNVSNRLPSMFFRLNSQDALHCADWCEAGGIAGRGVLVDYIGYLEAVSSPRWTKSSHR
jgi:hypothetical protein